MKERIEEWRKQNPLRKWRDGQKLSRADVATLCGVSGSSVTGWEQGEKRPSPLFMQKVAQAMGIAQIGLELEWTRWYEQRPQ